MPLEPMRHILPSEMELVTPSWISTPEIRPDFRGPVTRAYQPLPSPAEAPPILQTLRFHAETTPDAVAIVEAGHALTYRALMQTAGSLAARLGQAPPGNVAILMRAGIDYAVAVFAALAARRIAVLLDARFPERRNVEIAAATDARLVLLDPGAAGPDWPGVTPLREDAPAATIPTAALDLDAPAFILCTSGSSGAPKPIVHSQRTMLHWARATHDALHVTPGDRVLTLSSLATLGGFTALISYPLAGASIQMLDVTSAGLGRLLATLRDHPISILRGTPSLLRSLTDLAGSRSALSRLRVVQVYGEPLMKADYEIIRRSLPPGCLFRSTYGSTEASGLSWYAGPGDEYDPFRVATGILMPDTDASIRDDDGAPCTFGKPGELWIRSRYNALGEWRDGGVSEALFDPDPAGRIFRTGDIAVAHGDGVFVVRGRKDRMLKINGQRLEPAEIETALRQCGAVERAEVVVQRLPDGAAVLLAFVVARDGASADPSALRDMLRVRLPAHMIPARIVLVPEVPLLPGGKVDQAALLARVNRSPSAD